jgi:hypothetical protein
MGHGPHCRNDDRVPGLEFWNEVSQIRVDRIMTDQGLPRGRKTSARTPGNLERVCFESSRVF